MAMELKSAGALVLDSLTPSAVLYLVGVWVGYRILLALYNISPLHPLSRFPGPKIAALSYLYEAYYDWILGGRYGRRIKAMHDRYGPIVRINPDELHCDDPYFLDEIYTGPGRVRDKWYHQLNTGAVGPVAVTGFSTVNHELHRLRKGAFSRFFSRAQILKLEGEVLDFAHLTVDKILRCAGKGPLEIKEAFNCFTADVISQYSFGEPMGFIAQEGFTPNFSTWVASFLKAAYMTRHNVLVRKLGQLVPLMANYLGEDVARIMNQMNVVIPGYITKSVNDPDNNRLFAEVIRSKVLPEHEATMYRLSGEGFNFLMAGTETTAATLTVITFWLLAKPDVYHRLMDEFQGLNPDTLKWTELEQRPYFWAVIHEALRMTPGVSHRSARIAREEDLHYKSQDGKIEWVIPKGTPIGMTSMIQHWNGDLFPDPDEFRPERFLVDGKPNHKLQKFLMSFGKGSRSCIGENLAYCELYIMAALVAMRVVPRAKLHETTVEDLTYDHDLIVPQTKKGSYTIRVKIE